MVDIQTYSAASPWRTGKFLTCRELRPQNYRFRRRHLESYLYDDEILEALCITKGHPAVAPDLIGDKVAAIAASVGRGHPPDVVKSASGEIYNAAKRRLSLVGVGNNASAFMRSTLAPLVTNSTVVCRELRRENFRYLSGLISSLVLFRLVIFQHHPTCHSDRREKPVVSHRP